MLSYYSIYQAFSPNSLLITTLVKTLTLNGKEDLTHDFLFNPEPIYYEKWKG